MQQVFGRLGFSCGIDCEVEHDVQQTDSGAFVHSFVIDWDYDKVEDDTEIQLSLREDAVGHLYHWNPDCGFRRTMPLGWIGGKKSMTSISAPISCIYNGSGKNIFTCAVSEVKEIVELKTAIVGDTYFGMEIKIKLKQYVRRGHLELKLLIDETDIPMYTAIDNVRRWWEEDCGLAAMPVPECAKDAMYSYWYSFQQGIFQDEVLSEAERVAALGLTSVIIDDGWMMEGTNTRFAYAGDWTVHPAKFPDFAGTVEKMHSLGLKVLLWVGIPYVGEESELWNKWKDKTLQYSDYARASILDPRYPEVRRYIIDALIRIMTDYKLDGFKLDFIDLFYEVPGNTVNDEMDFYSVQEAVDCLMSAIKDELSQINPELMIEFRQKYIGPNMRKYGNMFRVTDCPDDYMSNRIGVLDLRLLSGSTAVHSDMLIWNESESVQTAALQIVNIIFATMQFSGRLAKLSEEHQKMVKFYMDFMAKNKEVLLNAPIIVEEPQLLYTAARTELNGKSVIAVYSNDKCITLNPEIKRNILLNGTERERLIVETGKAHVYRLEVRDCFGEVTRCENVILNAGLHSIEVPSAGVLTLERQG